MLLLFFCAGAGAAPYPTEIQLRAAIGSIAPLLKADGITLETIDAATVGLTQPLLAAGMTPNGETCRVFFNTKPENGLIEFFAAFDTAEIPLVLNSLAVHEAMHCFEQREAFIRQHFDKILPADFKPDTVTVQGYLSVVKSGALVMWGEALADIGSILYLQQAVPARWKYFADSLAAMRHGLAVRWPEHDTSPWLAKVIAADVDTTAGRNLFETALRLRSQYRPAP
jgi:hypothetical protein